jgi:hypothetical protein
MACAAPSAHVAKNAASRVGQDVLFAYDSTRIADDGNTHAPNMYNATAPHCTEAKQLRIPATLTGKCTQAAVDESSPWPTWQTDCC